MLLFDSANPLYSAASVGAIVSINQSTGQGVGLPNAIVVGSAHIAAFQPSAYDRNTINLVYPSLFLAGVVTSDTCSINGVTYTAVASAATAFQFNVGGTDALTAASLASQFNANQTLGYGAGIPISDASFDLSTTVSGTGTVSASMQLQGSMNGVDWFNHPNQAAQAPTGTTRNTVAAANLAPFPFLRTNVTALSGTGARVQVNYSSVFQN